MIIILNGLFDIHYIVTTVWDYPISLVKLMGTFFGLCNMVLAAQAKILNYPVGLINIVFYFAFFYQVQSYSNMLLQACFFIVSMYGWWKWLHPKEYEAKENCELKVALNSVWGNMILGIGIGLGTVLIGTLVKNLHLLLPELFQLPAAYPYYDSFIGIASVAAIFLLSQKKLENWILWIMIYGLCIVSYYIKNIKLMSLEYLLFFLIGVYGFLTWRKEYNGYRYLLGYKYMFSNFSKNIFLIGGNK